MCKNASKHADDVSSNRRLSKRTTNREKNEYSHGATRRTVTRIPLPPGTRKFNNTVQLPDFCHSVKLRLLRRHTWRVERTDAFRIQTQLSNVGWLRAISGDEDAARVLTIFTADRHRATTCTADVSPAAARKFADFTRGFVSGASLWGAFL